MDRITSEKKVWRKLQLDITNAGQDDGVPTSVLREISHLKAVDHPNIVKIEHAEVKSEFASLVYAYHEFNLLEFMRKE